MRIWIPALIALASLSTLAQAQDLPKHSESREVQLGVTYTAAHTSLAQDKLNGGTSSGWLQGGEADLSVGVSRGLSGVANFSGGHTSYGRNQIDCPGFSCPIVFEPGSLSYFAATFGPRYTYRQKKYAVYGEALFGFAHGSIGNSMYCFGHAIPVGGVGIPGSVCDLLPPQNTFAFRLGGGVDYNLTRRIAIRLPQVHWMRTSFYDSTQNSVQLGAGVVFRLR